MCSGPGWPLLDTLWGRLFLVWTPESFHDYLNLYPNLEHALCFVSSVDGNSGDDGGVTASDPASVFIQTFDSLSWSSPVTADEITSFESRVRSAALLCITTNEVQCCQDQVFVSTQESVCQHQSIPCSVTIALQCSCYNKTIMCPTAQSFCGVPDVCAFEKSPTFVLA